MAPCVIKASPAGQGREPAENAKRPASPSLVSEGYKQARPQHTNAKRIAPKTPKPKVAGPETPLSTSLAHASQEDCSV